MKLRNTVIFFLMGVNCFGVGFSANCQSPDSSMELTLLNANTKRQKPAEREITPSANPVVQGGADLFVTADWIWWKAVQEGTRYAATGIAPGSNKAFDILVSVPKGRAKSVGEDWSFGFQVGAGLNLSYDGWAIYAQYTWLRPSHQSSVIQMIDPVTNFGVISFQTPNIATGPYGDNENCQDYRWDRADASWSLHFNVIDLALGRRFFLSRFLVARLFFGLRGTWQEQQMDTSLSNSNGVALRTGVNPSGPYLIEQKNRVWGIGPRGGLDLSWYMAKNWSIYGDLSWTALWAYYTAMERKDTVRNDNGAGNGISPIVVNVDQNDHYCVKYIGELEIGLRFELPFNDGGSRFSIQTGWEQQVWVNWNTFNNLVRPDDWSDLHFHGLNLKARLDF